MKDSKAIKLTIIKILLGVAVVGLAYAGACTSSVSRNDTLNTTRGRNTTVSRTSHNIWIETIDGHDYVIYKDYYAGGITHHEGCRHHKH